MFNECNAFVDNRSTPQQLCLLSLRPRMKVSMTQDNATEELRVYDTWYVTEGVNKTRMVQDGVSRIRQTCIYEVRHFSQI